LDFYESYGLLVVLDNNYVRKNLFGIYIYRINMETIEQYASNYMKEKLRQLMLFDLRLRQEEEVKTENT
jgi:hypothetical protein